MKIITLDGPNNIGISSQARVLSLNLKAAKKTVKIVAAKTIDDLMSFLDNYNKKENFDFIILDGCAINDLSRAVIDSTIQTVPFKKYPNFINQWIEFNLKNNMHNILILPKNPTSFLEYRKINDMQEFIDHTNAAALIPTIIPHNGLKYSAIYVEPQEKILQIYKKIVFSDQDLDFLKYLS